jgi:hypothetical protein
MTPGSGVSHISLVRVAARSRYIFVPIWGTPTLCRFLWPYIESRRAEDCAILAPSIRSKTPRHHLKQLSNALSRKGVPVSVGIYDDASLDEDVIRGKLVVSTYHQFKGSEPDLVIVFGADDSWFKWFGADAPCNHCPNPVFVALTRARKQVSGLFEAV